MGGKRVEETGSVEEGMEKVQNVSNGTELLAKRVERVDRIALCIILHAGNQF